MHELQRGLPRNIIERVNDMTDDEVSHYPDVLSAVAELAVIEEAMAKRQDQTNAIRTKVESIDSSIADLTQDQTRVRSNIQSLNSVAGQQDLVQQYARQLAANETKMAALRDQQSELKRKKTALE